MVESNRTTRRTGNSIGPVEVSTIPFDSELHLRTATYTPSGKVLVDYNEDKNADRRQVNLAVMDDNGENMHTFFSGTIPHREKDNGLRYMIFPDNERIFLGDFVIECEPNIDECEESKLVPVEYPEEVTDSDHITHRWSEIIVAPDNEHISWTSLYSYDFAVVFTGKLEKENEGYSIASPKIVSRLDRFREDPENPGAVVPKEQLGGGEVKQFVEGGTAISMAGAKTRVTADSVVQDLETSDLEQITDTPGYNETTIFSPGEDLGIVMTTRFSEPTNMSILGLMPRPYPVSLRMGLIQYNYLYAVTGVRRSRSGNVGPALIDIDAEKSQDDYRGVNLNTEDEWVYHSPMSWHPSGEKAMWLEGRRGSGQEGSREMRMQVVRLLDYEPAPPVESEPTPDEIPFATTDLSEIEDSIREGEDIDITVQGDHSGSIEYRNTAKGKVEKKYNNFSDDGERIYNGIETMQKNPRGRSTYIADVELSGEKSGIMDLKITFGPWNGESPAELVFSEDDSGTPLTYGYAEYDGQRLEVDSLVE